MNDKHFLTIDTVNQGTNARKVNCGRVYSAYIVKPVLSGGRCKQE